VEQETAIRDVVSDNREVPLVAGIGVFPWKKTRFDKIVLERMTAERINRVLSGGIARVVKETR
jgi:arabinogalactan endo-1,4-beta-galactosidase